MGKPAYNSEREFSFIGLDRRQIKRKEVDQYVGSDYKKKLFAMRLYNEQKEQERKDNEFKAVGINARLFDCF